VGTKYISLLLVCLHLGDCTIYQTSSHVIDSGSIALIVT